ncbi:MAG: bifunctional hydroxymethylpyrimidine kinase/phosphomethylpyrimidine kinase [Planctomycetota bacterium]|nr:MAG: bifunctional hydroxymethylpyrimidine kinase/phosphomethylpyrimidine kinase [Planctomycetota bacterium]
MTVVRVVCVAGDDPGAGAGLQRDRAVAEALGCDWRGVTAVRTVQDEQGLRAAVPASAAQVGEELADLLAAGPAVVKTGALGDAAVVRAVAAALAAAGRPPLVVDPVRRASRTAVPGVRLLDDAGWREMRRKLLPLATVATPNRDEYGDGAAFAACPAVLLTGGDAGGPEVVDRLLRRGLPPLEIRHPRLPGGEAVHGTGCALSTALACRLGAGDDLERAARAAVAFVADWLAGGRPQ